MAKQHLTFRDIADLIEHGFDMTSDKDRPINVQTPTHMDFYDFERIEPNVPGSDRMVRLTFYGEQDEVTHQQWGWCVIDRDDDGTAYKEQYGSAATFMDALIATRSVAWEPPPSRLIELLRTTSGLVTCIDGTLTFPDGTQVRIPSSL